MGAVRGDLGDGGAVEPTYRRWVTFGVTSVLVATGLALAAVPVVVARSIYGYFTREYQPSFGTPIGEPFEFWLAEVAGVLGAALILTAVVRGRARSGQSPLTRHPAKPLRLGRVSALTAATLCVGFLSILAPFVGGDPTFIEGPLNQYARNWGFFLNGLTLLADLLLVGWVVSIVRAGIARYPGISAGSTMSATEYPTTSVKSRNSIALAGMVCGIVGLSFVLGLILGPLAVILGLIGLSRSKASGTGRGQAVAGIVLGVIDILVYLVIVTVSS